jgi:hypothetical protein
MIKLKYPTVSVAHFFFAMILGFMATNSFAYDANFSVGNLCEYVGKIQTDDNGATNTCEFNPYLSAAMDVSITDNFFLSPEFGFTIPQHGRDENISTMTLFALANTKYKFSMLHLIGGAGLFFTRISASGGTEELNNGGTTSSFPLPEGAVYTRNFIVNLGVGADFTPTISADLHTYIFNLLSSDDRAFSVLINGTYHFGEF